MKRSFIILVVLVSLAIATVALASGHRGSDRFDDVPRGHYADEEIGWAVEYDITKGVSRYRFDPNGTVTRAQIVTFLYRLNNLWEEGQPRDLTDVYEEFDDFTDDLSDLQKRLALLERSDGQGDLPSSVTTTTNPGGPIQNITCSRTGTTVEIEWDLHAGDTSIPANHRASRASVRNGAGDVLLSPIVLNTEIINPNGMVSIRSTIDRVTGQTYSRCEVRILTPSSKASADNRRISDIECTLDDPNDEADFSWTLGKGSQQLPASTVAFQASLRVGSQTLYSDIKLNPDVIEPTAKTEFTGVIAEVEGTRYSSCTVKALR